MFEAIEKVLDNLKTFFGVYIVTFREIESNQSAMIETLIDIKHSISRLEEKIDALESGGDSGNGGGSTGGGSGLNEDLFKWSFYRITGSRQVKFFKVHVKNNGKTTVGGEYGERWKITHKDIVHELSIPPDWDLALAIDWGLVKYVRHYDGAAFKEGFIVAYINSGRFRSVYNAEWWDPENRYVSAITAAIAPTVAGIRRRVRRIIYKDR